MEPIRQAACSYFRHMPRASRCAALDIEQLHLPACLPACAGQSRPHQETMILPLRPLHAHHSAQDARHLVDPIHAPGCRHNAQPLGPCTLRSRPSVHLGSRPSHRHSHTRSVLARESHQPQPQPEPEPDTPREYDRRGERDPYRCCACSPVACKHAYAPAVMSRSLNTTATQAPGHLTRCRL